MWFQEWLITLWRENAPLVVAIGIAFWLLSAATVGAALTRSTSMLASASFFVTGGMLLTALIAKSGARDSAVALVIVLLAEGIACLSLFLALVTIREKEERLRRRAELRKVEYTLPDKDNSYVRSRLQTTLKAPEAAENAAASAQAAESFAKDKQEAVRLGYARKLLAQIKSAPLSPAERLEVEEISRLFSFYLAKSDWNAAEARAVNDLFSCLLKIAAKYSVSVQ